MHKYLLMNNTIPTHAEGSGIRKPSNTTEPNVVPFITIPLQRLLNRTTEEEVEYPSSYNDRSEAGQEGIPFQAGNKPSGSIKGEE